MSQRRSADHAGGRANEPRTFTAEITFSGLGVLDVLEPDKWDDKGSRAPRRSPDVKMLLVRSDHAAHDGHGHHRHLPRLNYYADDHLGLRPWTGEWPYDYDLYPCPDGRETVSLNLTDKLVRIVPPHGYKAPDESELLWCGPREDGTFPDFPDLKDPEQERCLDWVLRGEQIGFGVPDPQYAVTEIEVVHGRWRSHGIYRNREVRDLDAISWRIGQQRQAMGRDLVLELPDLGFGLTLRICDRVVDPRRSNPHDIVLTPGAGDRLMLSMTNLPDSYSHPDISHVTMYSHLAGPQSKPVLAPVQSDDVVCAQASCNQVIARRSGK